MLVVYTRLASFLKRVISHIPTYHLHITTGRAIWTWIAYCHRGPSHAQDYAQQASPAVPGTHVRDANAHPTRM